jgi:hypothetical protein
MELYDMPPAMFNVLSMIAYEKQLSEDGKKEIQADVTEDILEEGGIIP